MNLLKAPRLVPSDCVGIVAPSLPLFDHDRETYANAKRVIEQMGFRTLEGETLHLINRWSAGTAQQQADDINAMFANPDVRAIIGHTGGFSSMGVVDMLDFELIAQNPKPFIGLSDITVYQWAMFSKTGLVGFHTNDLTFGFGQQFLAESAENQAVLKAHYLQALTSADPLGRLPFSDEIEVWRPGSAEGMLIGGNLKRFMLLAGTDYFPPIERFDGAILFWDDIGETYYDIAIYLQKLGHIGVLDRISGMVVCRPVWMNSYFDHIDHPTLEQMVLELTAEYDFPIINNVKLGHHTSSLVLPIGCQARFDSAVPELVVLESAVI